MTRVRITPAVLKWAQKRVGLTNEQLAKKVGLIERPQDLMGWINGVEQPTFRQVQALARALQIPIGYLFLSAPPPTILPVADFRSLPDSELGNFSPDLQDVLNDALRKRDWFREWRIYEGYTPLHFIGRYSTRNNPHIIAEDIRKALSLPKPTATESRTKTEHLRSLVRHVEEAGILVLQSGIVLNNPNRKLSVDEFRGFALVDEFAPLIFINAKDFIAARIFTLAHELGHIWTGTSGISSPELYRVIPTVSHSIEHLCNQIAAELLVPAEILIAQWNAGQDLYEYAQNLAGNFLVSVFVILIRSYELGLASQDEFQLAYSHALSEVHGNRDDEEVSGGGGDFYKNLIRRNSRLLVQEVTTALSEGQLLHQEAAQLLNIQTRTLKNAILRWS